MERVWDLPSLHKAAASEHSATATSTLARQSQAGYSGTGCTGCMASSRVESDVGVVARLVDPLKMSSLMQDETDTELNARGPFATGSLPIPSSPAPVPPPDGELCIHRRAWANLEREPSHLPAEPSSYDLVD